MKSEKEANALDFRNIELKVRSDYEMKVAECQKNRGEYDIMKTNFENALAMKEGIISSQKKIIEEYDERLASLVSNHEKALKEKDDEIDAMGQCDRSTVNATTPATLVARSAADMFKSKPSGRSAKNINVNDFKCEFPDCNEVGVDTVQCNICSKWTCESCQEMQINKLKAAFSKCSSAYFLCKTCDESALLNGVKRNDIDNSGTNETKFERLILSKLEGIEERIDETINRKLAENNVNIEQKMKQVSDSYAETLKHSAEITENCKSFKESLLNNMPTNSAAPIDFKRIIRETENEKLVQDKERESRARNIIIHGIPEQPDTEATTDTGSVKELFTAIEVDINPKTISRVGTKKAEGSRPLKVILETVNDKNLVMNNLPKLKNAPVKLKSLSITDDYTLEERQEIRAKVAEAKEKTINEGEGKFIFKIRGTPKNGLKIVRFTLRKQENRNEADPVIQA